MEKVDVLNDIVVFGMQVTTFPEGIGECFDSLARNISDGFNRSYYGISWMEKDGSITYYAFAEEQFAGESNKYNYTVMKIEKGEYLAVTVKNWRKKTHTMKDIFHNMMKNENTDSTKPCIEWYKSDDEMICMMKAKR